MVLPAGWVHQLDWYRVTDLLWTCCTPVSGGWCSMPIAADATNPEGGPSIELAAARPCVPCLAPGCNACPMLSLFAVPWHGCSRACLFVLVADVFQLLYLPLRTGMMVLRRGALRATRGPLTAIFSFLMRNPRLTCPSPSCASCFQSSALIIVPP